MKLYYPVKPFHVVQTFGNDPVYYARFHDQFGVPEKGHMGIDMEASHGTPVYAACDGMAYAEKDSHGGEGIIIETDPDTYLGALAFYHIVNWHLCGDTDPKYPSPLPLDGSRTRVKAGDLIGHADNTGAPFESSGDHLHFGLIPFNPSGNAINPSNGYNGNIDPLPFFNGLYAVDMQIQSLQMRIIEKLKQLVALLSKK